MPWRGPQTEGEVPTLGWLAVDWIESNCVVPDGPFSGQPFRLTLDNGTPTRQGEFVLGMYQLVPTAEASLEKPSRAFQFDRGGQLVAPQKWGKGPLSAAIILFEAFGPALFDGWDANGEPVGRPWPTPWIQVTAISEDQTANIYRALIPMIELGGLKADIPDTGETRVNLPSGGRIEPVTASARSRLGQRITFSAQDEAHDWQQRNGGRKLADTQRRNLAGMGGRFLETGNAWDPAEDSVAQTTFERETGVFKMLLDGGPGSAKNVRERMKVLTKLYGGNPWVDPERIASEIDNLFERGEYAQAERFFLNRIVPGEDRVFDPRRWKELERPGVEAPKNARIVIGVDGARYRDALGIIATEVSSGFQWPLAIYERPENAPEDYEHDFDAADGVMKDAFDYYDVWRVYIDPGSQVANIAPLMEKWQGRWGVKRIIEWQMTRLRPTSFMIRNFVSAVMTGDLTHNGDLTFARHVGNARRKQTNVIDEDGRAMYVMQKDSPNSPAKIDAAAAAALSWEARSDAVAAGKVISSYDDPTKQCATCKHLERLHVPACRVRPEGHCKAFAKPDLEESRV